MNYVSNNVNVSRVECVERWEKKNSRIYPIYLWFWNWKIHTFNDGEDYHHFEPHILFRRLKMSYRLRLFFQNKSKERCGREEVRWWNVLYMFDDEWRLKKGENFPLSGNFSLDGHIIWGFDDNIPRLMAKTFLCSVEKDVKMTRVFSSDNSQKKASRTFSHSFFALFIVNMMKSICNEKRYHGG